MATTQLLFLGPVHFVRDDQDIELNIGKVQALLAYLAATGAPQTREHLLELLWAESHPEAARKNLRNSLWRMRQKMGDDVLISEDNWVMLSSPIWTDITSFEAGMQMVLDPANHPSVPLEPIQLESMLDLCRGPLL